MDDSDPLGASVIRQLEMALALLKTPIENPPAYWDFGPNKRYGTTRLETDVVEEAYANLERGNLEGFLNSIKTVMMSIVMQMRGNQTLEDVFPEEVRQHLDTRKWPMSLINPTSPIPPLRDLYKRIKQVSDYAFEDYDSALGGMQRNVRYSLSYMGMLRLFAEYAPKAEDIAAEDIKSRQKYLSPSLDKDYQPAPRAMVRDEGINFLPHQTRVDNHLKNIPKHAVLDSATGSGKTIMILHDAMRGIEKGVWKRPIILCPNNLVADYVSEAAFLTKGKMNVIPLTTDILNRHGYDTLKEMIKKAPRNTVIVASMDLPRGSLTRSTSFGYGGADPVMYSLNAEFLRDIGFDYVAIDESHRIKNASARSEAVQKFVADIPYKRLGTGTFITNDLSDARGQMAALNPLILGSQDQFNTAYSVGESKHGSSLGWKFGAEATVRRIIDRQCSMVTVRKREMAASMPRMIEQFHIVDNEFTYNQREIYRMIFDSQIERLKTDFPEVYEAIRSGLDDEMEDSPLLARIMKAWYQRMERFLTAPDEDDLGQHLSPPDNIGPKVAYINKILKKHFDGGKINPDEEGEEAFEPDGGKVFILTVYLPSAKSIYENIDKRFRNMAVHYKAATADVDLQRFKTDPKVKILIGAEQSLREGHNLQMASRLIRVECVWNPGDVVQVNARMHRLDPKGLGGRREFVYLDWLVVNRTIDVTKASRLISKIISKAKFDEADKNVYQNLDDLPKIPINLETIQSENDWQESLKDYLVTYQDFNRIESQQIDKWIAEHPDDHLNAKKIEADEKLRGAKHMNNLPFTENMTLPKGEELGLLPIGEFVSNEGGPADTVNTFDMLNPPLPVVVEGERWGLVSRSGKDAVTVDLVDGRKLLGVPKSSLIVIVDKNGKPAYEKYSKKDLRKEIEKEIGLKGNKGELPGPRGRVGVTGVSQRIKDQMDVRDESGKPEKPPKETPTSKVLENLAEKTDRQFNPNDRVIVKIASNLFYLGTVSKVSKSGKRVTVEYDDGDVDKHGVEEIVAMGREKPYKRGFPAKRVKKFTAGAVKKVKSKYQVDDRIVVRYEPDGDEYYLATVTGVEGDQVSFLIDGDDEDMTRSEDQVMGIGVDKYRGTPIKPSKLAKFLVREDQPLPKPVKVIPNKKAMSSLVVTAGMPVLMVEPIDGLDLKDYGFSTPEPMMIKDVLSKMQATAVAKDLRSVFKLKTKQMDAPGGHG